MQSAEPSHGILKRSTELRPKIGNYACAPRRCCAIEEELDEERGNGSLVVLIFVRKVREGLGGFRLYHLVA